MFTIWTFTGGPPDNTGSRVDFTRTDVIRLRALRNNREAMRHLRDDDVCDLEDLADRIEKLLQGGK